MPELHNGPGKEEKNAPLLFLFSALLWESQTAATCHMGVSY